MFKAMSLAEIREAKEAREEDRINSPRNKRLRKEREDQQKQFENYLTEANANLKQISQDHALARDKDNWKFFWLVFISLLIVFVLAQLQNGSWL